MALTAAAAAPVPGSSASFLPPREWVSGNPIAPRTQAPVRDLAHPSSPRYRVPQLQRDKTRVRDKTPEEKGSCPGLYLLEKMQLKGEGGSEQQLGGQGASRSSCVLLPCALQARVLTKLPGQPGQ